MENSSQGPSKQVSSEEERVEVASMEDRDLESAEAVVAPTTASVHHKSASCSSNNTLSDAIAESSSEESQESSGLLSEAEKSECRICQEEDVTKNLEAPCACAGSLKYAHKKCIQRWCNEKGNANCEICHQPYSGSYSILPRRQLLRPEDIPLDLREELAIPFGSRSLLPPDARVFAVREGEQVYLEVEYEEYDANNSAAASWCRSMALIVLAILLLRHALSPFGGSDDEEPDLFTLFMLRAIGILVPCYILARAFALLQKSRRAYNPNSIVSADGSTLTLAVHPRITSSPAEEDAEPAPNAPLVQNQA